MLPPRAGCAAASITSGEWLGSLIKALALAGRAPWRAQPLWRPSPKAGQEVMRMAARCVLCGSEYGIRTQCPERQGRVVCRNCCLREGSLPGHECLWWELCCATDLRQWEW
jgi:hypothetical protein